MSQANKKTSTCVPAVKPIKTHTVLEGIDITDLVRNFSNEGSDARTVDIHLHLLSPDVRTRLMDLTGSTCVLLSWYSDSNGEPHLKRSWLVEVASYSTVSGDSTRLSLTIQLRSPPVEHRDGDTYEQAVEVHRVNST